jgi:hypothetical protein
MRITLSSFSPGLFPSRSPQSRKSDEKSVKIFRILKNNKRDLGNFLHRLTLTSKSGSNITNKNLRDICVKEIVHSAAEDAREAIWERRAGRPRRGPWSNGLFSAGSCSGDPNVRGFGGYPISPDIVVPGHPLNVRTHSTNWKGSYATWIEFKFLYLI